MSNEPIQLARERIQRHLAGESHVLHDSDLVLLLAHTAPPADLDRIMEQAQVFASAWSMVGGRFDNGSALEDANAAKAELRGMLANRQASASLAPIDEAPSDRSRVQQDELARVIGITADTQSGYTTVRAKIGGQVYSFLLADKPSYLVTDSTGKFVQSGEIADGREPQPSTASVSAQGQSDRAWQLLDRFDRDAHLEPFYRGSPFEREILHALQPWRDSLCKTCNGNGEVGGYTGQTPESFGYDSQECPDCKGTGSATQQPASAQVVPEYWAAVDESEGEVEFAISTDDGNGGQFARDKVNEWINDRILERKLRLKPLYLHPPAVTSREVPKGWQLVPKQATTEMWKAIDACGLPWVSEQWTAMLAAAPSAPKEQKS